MVFILISSDRHVQSRLELSALDWHKIKTDELVAVSIERATGNVFQYSTIQQEWVKR